MTPPIWTFFQCAPPSWVDHNPGENAHPSLAFAKRSASIELASLLAPKDAGGVVIGWNVKGPHAYIKQVSGSGRAVDGSEALSPGRARGEAAMIGVRLLGGTDSARDFPEQRRHLVGAGLLLETDGQVRLTRRGVELANQVGAAFLS